jgi:hypothetical protein
MPWILPSHHMSSLLGDEKPEAIMASFILVDKSKDAGGQGLEITQIYV